MDSKKEDLKSLIEFGIININKPSGPTSFSVSNFIKNKLKIRKTSHFGTLDPKVTGVLPIALNRACKLTGYFIGKDKEYVGIMRIHQEKNLEEIQEVINKKFIGKIIQMPPLKSRVKRQKRKREIYEFTLLEKEGNDFIFRVKCEGGTYIRKLINDLGEEMEIGAHMLELRRTKAGIFNENCSINLYEFEKAVEEYLKGNEEILKKMIIPAEVIAKVYPVVKIKKDELKKKLTGKPLYKNDLVKDEGWKTGAEVSVFCEGKFIGMYEIFRGKEIFAKPKFVMQPIN